MKEQSLSAMSYIKNNKRRISVLIISLSLCFMLIYVTQVLLMSTEETFKKPFLENSKKIQYLSFAASSLGIDTDQDPELINQQYDEKLEQTKEKLEQVHGVLKVYNTTVIYSKLTPPVGNLTIEIPLIDSEDIPELIHHMDAKLIEGNLPKKMGEVILDSASMLNNHYKIGDYLNQDDYGETYKITGILKCSTYFGCGIPKGERLESPMLVSLSDGTVTDFTSILKNMGINIRDHYDTIFDYSMGEKWIQEEVRDQIKSSTKYVYSGIMILLFIALLIVYITYLRERHNEWCLYCSIGYSRKAIYFSIMRELLFTFGTAIAAGLFTAACLVLAIDYRMLKKIGIICKYFYPETLIQILCSYVLLFGLLQIPIRYALYKIRTIDAMDDELY